jgi:hypothetical protein
LNIQILLIPCTRSTAIAFAAAKLFLLVSVSMDETNVCIRSRYRSDTTCCSATAGPHAIATTAGAGSIRAYGMVVNGLSLMADRPVTISISGPTRQFGSIGKQSCIEGVVRKAPPAAADNHR